jgi:hypothetical protein
MLIESEWLRLLFWWAKGEERGGWGIKGEGVKSFCFYFCGVREKGVVGG